MDEVPMSEETKIGDTRKITAGAEPREPGESGLALILFT
jgi:hypothetical protein